MASDSNGLPSPAVLEVCESTESAALASIGDEAAWSALVLSGWLGQNSTTEKWGKEERSYNLRRSATIPGTVQLLQAPDHLALFLGSLRFLSRVRQVARILLAA